MSRCLAFQQGAEESQLKLAIKELHSLYVYGLDCIMK